MASDDVYLRGSFVPSEENLKDIDADEFRGMTSGLWPPMFHFLVYYGIYVIRFFKNYKWRYILIDDRLPCKEQGEIIYA